MPFKSIACAAGALLIVLLSCGGLFLALPDANTVALADRLRPPSFAHLLGTDELGRDLLSRLVTGTRYTILTAASTTIIAMMLGWLLGSAARTAPSWFGRPLVWLAYAGFILPWFMLSTPWWRRALAAMLCLAGLFPVLWLSATAIVLWNQNGPANILVLGPAFALAVAYAVYNAGRTRHRELPERTANAALPLGALIPTVFAWSVCSHIALDIIGLGVHSPGTSWGSLFLAESVSWWPYAAVSFGLLTVTASALALGDLAISSKECL